MATVYLGSKSQLVAKLCYLFDKELYIAVVTKN